MTQQAPIFRPPEHDPYAQTEDAVREPPKGWRETLKYLGPGLVLVGSIVGSGELLLTTNLGRVVGMAALWLIVVSCLIKVLVQAELGRATISTGQPCLTTFNALPGPRWRVSWFVWIWAFTALIGIIGGGGIVGGVGQALQAAFPFMDQWTNGHVDRVFAYIMGLITILLLYSGAYGRVERISTFLVGAFTFVTVVSFIALQSKGIGVTLSGLVEGFSFARLSHRGMALAMAAYAGTGVAAGELIAYTYWCVEKGYGRFAGTPEPGESWANRARGWIRVMHLDVLLTMGVFTIATLSFYFLGGFVLHKLDPSGADLTVKSLAGIYTQTLGGWATPLFLFGAFCVLYSTTVSGTAGTSRMVADAASVFGFTKVDDFRTRLGIIRFMIVLLPILQATAYWLLKKPVFMLWIASFGGMIMLPSITFGALWYRYKVVDPRIRPTWRGDLAYWLCAAAIFAISAWLLWTNIPVALSGKPPL